MAQNRDPRNVQAWIIGSGIASLAAAVNLIKKAKVPGHQVHILDAHDGSGGAIQVAGDAEKGYILHTGAQPYFLEPCVEDLLAVVPSVNDPNKTVLETIKKRETHDRPVEKATTRAIRLSQGGMSKVDMHRTQIGPKLRMDLIAFIFDNERPLESKKIRDVFPDSFFQSEFWALWSTMFLLNPWHCAAEFRRLLVKYLSDLHTHVETHKLERTRFSLYESLIVPITKYLKDQGVDFRFHAMVTDLRSYPDSDPTTISEIVTLDNGKEELITVDPVDIVIVTLGSMSTGMQVGSNQQPPSQSSPPVEESQRGPGALWEKLARQSSKFGNPSNFFTRTDESKIETFTITLRNSKFMDHYIRLTKDQPGTLLNAVGSPWCLSVNVPNQPVFAEQPQNVDVIWGYGLRPEAKGKYVMKPMEQCSGAEILFELFSHLGLATDELLSSAITVPCLMPRGTSMLLTRSHHDRPNVIPHMTTNIALIGQYVEIPDDTTLSVEYSVRGARMAVTSLMGGLQESIPKVRKNVLWDAFELMV
ncbi:myosin-cross-reactive antigen family protein [Aspergillus sclerotialis]|uniref:Myosin-cross-reactive antigen family protein n=1 Tax=Aspergillus sclerotialis TaxID=2070753 RepID=A0A3A2ZBE9_9EURO|nr:myosin-cross-reactive antigen family protein [Aspergillus sclerotialis]